jgi:hypothetical protein
VKNRQPSLWAVPCAQFSAVSDWGTQIITVYLVLGGQLAEQASKGADIQSLGASGLDFQTWDLIS